MQGTIVKALASLVSAMHNCREAGNAEWHEKHSARAKGLVDDYLPHGSGFDDQTTLDVDASDGDKLVFHTSYHHMDEGGSYDGWTEHTVTITPSLWAGFHIKVSGRNRNDIKDYIAEMFHSALSSAEPVEVPA